MRSFRLVQLALLVTAAFAVACGGNAENASNGDADAYGERNAVTISDTSVTVEMRNLQFDAQGIRIKPGSTVTWVNKDSALHNVSQIESVFLSQDEMKEGNVFSFTFEKPGTYRYQCTFHHPTMNGVVIVEG